MNWKGVSKMKVPKAFKKISKLFLACAIGASALFPNGIIKAATYNLTEKYQGDWYFFGSDKYGNGSILYLNGKEAFCIEPDKVSAIGPNEPIKPSDIGLTNKQMEDMALITWYGYRSKSKPSKNDYMMTQNAVWRYLGSSQRMGNSTYPDEASMKSWFNNVMNKVTHFHDKPSFDRQTITVDMGETASITDTKKVLSGLKIKSVRGGTASISGNTLKVTPDGTKDTMSITFNRGLSVAQTKDTIVVRQGNSQAVSSLTGLDPYDSYLRINVNRTGSLKITKQDEDGNKVPNTSFKVSKNADMTSPLGTYTTGSDGTVTVNDLEKGTWYVQETSVPSHLVLDSTVKSVTINPNETTSFTATNNWVKGKIKLRKVDSKTNEQVGGATYAVYNSQGQELERLVTTATGFVESGYLRFGNYTVKEIIAPEGYVLNSQEYSVTVSENEQRIEVTGSDKPIEGYIQVLKRDAESGKTVVKANTTFSVYKSDDTYVTDITTNNNGIAKSDLLRYGGYYLIEKTAPDGYTHSDEKLVYNITEDGKTYEAVLSNTRVKGQINLSKEDSVTGKEPQGEATLDGAVYEVRARENILDPADGSILHKKDTLIATLTTDAQGNASTNDQLYLGKYQVKEVKPSNGYTLDTKTYEVDLTYENQNVALVTKSVTSLEKVISQPFEIIKISDNGTGEADLLEGAEFTIKAQKDIDKYGSWEKAPVAKNANGEPASVLVTDKKGYARSDELPYGKYVVRETKTPPNHLTVKDFTVTITEDSREPQTWRIFNDEKFKAVVAIVKEDADTGNVVAIEGATFKIRNLQTNDYVGYWEWFPYPHYVKTWKTTEDGTVMTGKTLDAGEYQIEEIKAPNGYIINTEPVKFMIGTDEAYQTLPDGQTPVITVVMEDKPVKGRIKVAKEGEVLMNVKKDKSTYGNLYFGYETRKLANATFEIYANENIYAPDNSGTLLYAKDELVETVITGADGTITSTLLPLGKYFIIEKTAPDGFVISKERIEVELKYEGQDIEVVFSDLKTFRNERQKVDIELVKKDSETKTPLAGAIFGLYAKEDIVSYDGQTLVKAGERVDTVTSDEDGKVVFNKDIPLSKYEVKEIQPPVGYASSDEVVTVDASYQGQDVPVIEYRSDFFNDITKVEISKKDIANDEEIRGAYLTVYPKDDKGAVFDTWVSGQDGVDEDGNIKPHMIKGLEPGEYSLEEKSSPYGYAIAQKVDFTVKDTGEVQSVEMKDEMVFGQLKFDKVGEIFNQVIIGQNEFGITHSPVWNKSNLLGAEITIYAGEDITIGNHTYYEKDEKVETLESDWVSTYSKKLPVGLYYYVETKTPHGYIIDTDKHYFTIEDSKVAEIQIVDAVLENTRPKVNIDMTKVMEEQEIFRNPDAYKNVVFGIYAREDIYDYMGNVGIKNGQMIATTGIDENGHLVHVPDLPNGMYYIKELQTDKQYVLDDTEYNFVISYHGQDVSEYTISIGTDGTVHNKLARGSVMIHKKDSLNSDVKLKDVPFEISASKDMKDIISTVVTDENGVAIFDNLELGVYYIREAKQVDGYTYNSHVYRVEITEDTQIVEITVENKPAEMSFRKVDKSTQKMLEGAIMQVIDYDTGEVVAEFTSSKEESYKLPYLVEDKVYALKEVKAPKGYKLASDVLFMAEDGKTVTMEDVKIPEPVKTGVDVNTKQLFALGFAGLVVGFFAIKMSRRKQ